MSRVSLYTTFRALIGVLCGGLCCVGCSSETPGSAVDEGLFPSGNDWVELSFVSENAQQTGRASVVEDQLTQAGTILRWDAGDKVTMWMGEEHIPCTFVTEQGGNSTASFIYKGKTVDTKNYFGFYPAQETVSGTTLTLSVPTDGTIRQEKANDSRHLAPYRAMYAPKVSRQEENSMLTGVRFYPLTSLVVFRLINETPEKVSYCSVGLVADELPTENMEGKIFFRRAAYEAGSGNAEVTVDGESKTSAATLSLGTSNQGMEVESKEQVLAFLPVFPSASVAGVPLRIELATNSGYVLKKPFPEEVLNKIGSFKTGTFYIFNVRQTNSGLVIDSPVIGEWEDGGDIELPID